jgi:DNA-binding response OmpR family regulator
VLRPWDRDRDPRPSLAEVDILMPELDGLSLCRRLRGGVPIVMLSRTQRIAAVYGDDHPISARTVDTHVRNLRAKLAAAGAPVAGVRVIETVHGVGYRCS